MGPRHRCRPPAAALCPALLGPALPRRLAGDEPPQFSLSAWFAAPQVERALSQPQQAQQAQQRHHQAGAGASSLNAYNLNKEPGLLGRRSAKAGALAAAGAAVWCGAARGAALLPVPFVWGLAAVLASVGLLDTGISRLPEESSSSSTVGGAGAGAGTACQADATPHLAPAASSGPEAASEDRDSSAEPPAPAAAPLLPSSSLDGVAAHEDASHNQPAAHAALHDGAGRPAANGAPPAAQLGAAGAVQVVMDAAVVHQLEDLMPELGISAGSPALAPGALGGCRMGRWGWGWSGWGWSHRWARCACIDRAALRCAVLAAVHQAVLGQHGWR